MLTLALTLLGAIGFDYLLGDPMDSKSTRWAFWCFAAAGLALVGVAAANKIRSSNAVHLGGLIWPTAQVVLGLAFFGYLVFAKPDKRPTWMTAASVRRTMAALLLSIETAFLIFSGVSFWSLSSDFFSPTPAVSQLQAAVGNQLVGLGSCLGFQSSKLSTGILGIRPDANIGFGVRELAVYDPIIPAEPLPLMARGEREPTPSSLTRLGSICAGIATANQAKVFGVGYVLEPQGSPGQQEACATRLSATNALFHPGRLPGVDSSALVPRKAHSCSLPRPSPRRSSSTVLRRGA